MVKRLNHLFTEIRETRWTIIISFYLFYGFIVSAINFTFSNNNIRDVLLEFFGSRQALILVLFAPLFYLFFSGFLLAIGKLHASDIGLVWSRLLPGLAITLLVWVFVQLIEMIVGLTLTGSVKINPKWVASGSLDILIIYTSFYIGNALVEEVAFRGFLLPQLYFKFKNNSKPQQAITFAVFVSLLMFSLYHIPNYIIRGLSIGSMLLGLFTSIYTGLFYTLIYLRSKNLFFAAGVHSLANALASDIQTHLFAGSTNNETIVLFELIIVTAPILMKKGYLTRAC